MILPIIEKEISCSVDRESAGFWKIGIGREDMRMWVLHHYITTSSHSFCLQVSNQHTIMRIVRYLHIDKGVWYDVSYVAVLDVGVKRKVCIHLGRAKGCRTCSLHKSGHTRQGKFGDV